MTAPDFDTVIAPLLAGRCVDCHRGDKPKGGLDLSTRGGALKGGENGPAVVPGKPADSLLWQHVDAGEMPPKKPLPDAERQVLRAWVAAGAPWGAGAGPIDPLRYTSAARAGYDWWALRPVAAVEPPSPAGAGAASPAGWGRNPIDGFVLARLAEKQLAPSPEADRRTLIRRLSFDLLGLPPSPDEVDAFVKDAAPDAYERLVDRLLASPHYGERWARHWLDVVRFGESNGFERDLPRENAWPYRDWVVAALNADLPYDEFARLQIAGDVLRPGDADATIATGFLVAGAHDTVVPASDRMKAAMRQDELEDIVGTVGQTFLGLTVACARCHDHKFDPISQREYYRMAAALAGVGHGEREVKHPPPAELPAAAGRVADLARRLEAIESPARAALLADRHGDRATAPALVPTPVAAGDFTVDGRDLVGSLHTTGRNEPIMEAKRGPKFTPRGVTFDGKGNYLESAALPHDLAEKTLSAWVSLDRLDQRGAGVMSIQAPGGAVFDGITFAEREPGRWMAGSDHYRRTKPFGGPAETAPRGTVFHVAIAYHADGTVAAYRDGKPYGQPYRVAGGAPVTFKAGEPRVVFGLRHHPAGGDKMLAGTIARAQLFDSALSADEVASLSIDGAATEAELLAKLAPAARDERRSVRAALAAARAERAKLEAARVRSVYAAVPKQPGPFHVLGRGNVTEPGELVSAGGLSAVAHASPDLGLAPDAPEGERRVRLARWLTDRRNPLFARVIVNRLWAYHFGVGIVETPNDLGFSGGRPSHPALLDWLAAELARRDFSLQAMHRLMVTSAAYRQSSREHAAGRRVDADNRLVWRGAARRLEAEAIRDAMLAVAGRLDRTVGGRGYQDFKSYFFKGTQFYDPVEQVGPAFNRRTVYRMWARGGRNPLLDTFDCPDPSATTPRRSVTITPLQALSLLNNAFVLDMADALAKRARTEAGPDATAQVGRAYRLALQRDADAAELRIAGDLVKDHGLAACC